MYNSGRGRFMQPDPIGLGAVNPSLPQSLNRYVYVQNDPVNHVDINGTDISFTNCTPEVVLDEEGFLRFTGWEICEVEISQQRRRRTAPTKEEQGDPCYADYDSAKLEKRSRESYPIWVDSLKNTDEGRKITADIAANIQGGIDKHIILCQAMIESGLYPRAEGGAGELGILQIKPAIANSLGLGTYTPEQLFDVATNTKLATTYLKTLQDKFNNDLYSALAAYKQGETSFRRKGICTTSREYADWIFECAARLKSENL
jgi:uncharacterized protein RhaS with RHS repeats